MDHKNCVRRVVLVVFDVDATFEFPVHGVITPPITMFNGARVLRNCSKSGSRMHSMFADRVIVRGHTDKTHVTCTCPRTNIMRR
jgi:hypothetical protein